MFVCCVYMRVFIDVMCTRVCVECVSMCVFVYMDVCTCISMCAVRDVCVCAECVL